MNRNSVTVYEIKNFKIYEFPDDEVFNNHILYDLNKEFNVKELFI
jgi:hypothetical protein